MSDTFDFEFFVALLRILSHLLFFVRLITETATVQYHSCHLHILMIIVRSADERFDGTYQTNIVVSNDGSMLYVPPGIFKSTCKVTNFPSEGFDFWIATKNMTFCPD